MDTSLKARLPYRDLEQLFSEKEHRSIYGQLPFSETEIPAKYIRMQPAGADASGTQLYLPRVVDTTRMLSEERVRTFANDRLYNRALPFKLVAPVLTPAGTRQLTYPMGVYSVSGKLLGNAATAAEFVALWNADAVNQQFGQIAVGETDTLFAIVSMERPFSVVVGSTMYAVRFKNDRAHALAAFPVPTYTFRVRDLAPIVLAPGGGYQTDVWVGIGETILVHTSNPGAPYQLQFWKGQLSVPPNPIGKLDPVLPRSDGNPFAFRMPANPAWDRIKTWFSAVTGPYKGMDNW